MPIHFNSRAEIIRAIPACIGAYNNSTRGPSYNEQYAKFIKIRLAGIRNGCLADWLKTSESGFAIRSLMIAFGMDKQGSHLVDSDIFGANVSRIPDIANIEWLSRFQLCEERLSKSGEGSTVAEEVTRLFNYCACPGHFSVSGRFVIGSKVAHCVLPQLFPMIDTRHIGISLHKVPQEEYLPPGNNWRTYIGHQPNGKPNPTPVGDGRKLWKADQILCAIGFYARIYPDWLALDETRNLATFLALDTSNGATGIPRLLDKVLWECPSTNDLP